MWFDLMVAELEELSREDLIALVRAQSGRIAELEDGCVHRIRRQSPV